MQIKKLLFSHGNDFTAILNCPHCGQEQKLSTGYHDAYYHNNVIPAITCQSYKKNQEGTIPANSNDSGMSHV